MRKLLVYLKDYKKETVLAPLFKMLEASFELFVPLVVAAIIDEGIAGQDRFFILQRCGILILLGLIGLVCSVTAQYYAARAAVGFTGQVRRALFKHIQSLSYTEIDTIGTSTMITRMTSDMNQVQNGLNLTLRLFLRSPFVVFGAMIMAFQIDVKCALIFLVTIPILSVVVFGIMLISIPLYRKVQQRLDGVLGIARENLIGVRVLRAFCKEDEEKERFWKKNEELTGLQKYVGRISALLNPLTYVIINLAILILIHTGAVQVELGILAQGQVVALYNYMSQILVELIKLANLIISMTRAAACARRIQSVFEIRSSMPDTGTEEPGPLMGVSAATEPEPAAAVPAVEFCHVNLRYADGGEDALSDIDFSVMPGETVGIIGGTGSGKSSLVNLIPRFYDATGGSVRIYGHDVKDYPVKSLRELVGVVPQKAALFHGSIRENLQWGKKDASDDEIMEAVRTAQAEEVVLGKEGGLDYEIEQGGRNLSGGQKQRLTIARALVKKPGILILDDSSSALDFATDAALRAAVRELSGQMTVFIVSQRASSILHADKILVLDDGKVAGMGTSEELLQSCQVYREIYETQFRKEAANR